MRKADYTLLAELIAAQQRVANEPGIPSELYRDAVRNTSKIIAREFARRDAHPARRDRGKA